MHEKSALRAISFDTGRVASGKSGNWMILADDGGSGSERCGVSFITAPRRFRLARKSVSLIVAAMDKSSWVSIAFLYADCYSSPGLFHQPPKVVNSLVGQTPGLSRRGYRCPLGSITRST